MIMSTKKWLILSVVVGILGVGVVSAQDGRFDRQRDGIIRTAIQAAAEVTGLEPREIASILRDDMTLAEIVEANGGDVQTVIDQALAAATERLNEAVSNERITQERADEMLANLEPLITEAINDGFPSRIGLPRLVWNGERILAQAVSDAIVLEDSDLRTMLGEGMTLAEIVEANGGNVPDVIADAVADATAQINEAVANGRLSQENADELIANLESFFTNSINGTRREHLVEIRVGVEVLQLAAKQTGLLPREIAEQVRNGTPLAEVLMANGVDVNDFIDAVVAQSETRLAQAVSNGRITQERADEMLANLREQLTERLSTTNPL
jgi:3-hydroxyacyl-CoA dehydrogenase